MMTTHFSRSLRLGVLLASAGLAASGAPALAQAQPEKPAEPPLKGPPVRNNRPPELEDRFAQGRGRAQAGAPLRELNAILGKLRSEEAPPAIRLTEEQDEKIKAIQDDLRRQMREFEAQRRAARPDAENPAQPGERPARPNRARPKRPQGEPGMTDMQGAPRPRDAMTRIHAVLTEPQQEFVHAELEKVREASEKRRAEEYVKRRMEERRGDPDAPAADRPAPERLRQIAERLRELPPQTRERLLRKFEEDLDKAEAAAGDNPDAKATDRKADQKPARKADKKPLPAVKQPKTPDSKADNKPADKQDKKKAPERT